MKKYEKIKSSIFLAVENVNQQLTKDQRIDLSVDSILIGDKSKLDSLQLVNLIIAIEEKIYDAFAVSINLMTESTMTQDVNHFQTIGTLIEYINQIIKNKETT